MKSLKDLRKLQFSELTSDVREYGWASEFNHNHNKISRAIVRAVLREKGEAWLWQINPYNGDADVIVRKYEKGMVYNFGASLVTPRYDSKLEQLIIDRLAAEYTGTKDDLVRVNEIMARAGEVGASHLFWS